MADLIANQILIPFTVSGTIQPPEIVLNPSLLQKRPAEIVVISASAAAKAERLSASISKIEPLPKAVVTALLAVLSRLLSNQKIQSHRAIVELNGVTSIISIVTIKHAFASEHIIVDQVTRRKRRLDVMRTIKRRADKFIEKATSHLVDEVVSNNLLGDLFVILAKLLSRTVTHFSTLFRQNLFRSRGFCAVWFHDAYCRCTETREPGNIFSDSFRSVTEIMP